MHQVYQSNISGISRGVLGVSMGVLGVSNVYKVYQTYISNKDICDILPFDVWAGFRFFIFANNKMCVLQT